MTTLGIYKPVPDRFWRQVEKTAGCWLWTGAASHGYGVIHVNGERQRATAVSWFLAHGEWPALQMLHSCDRPLCVRPDHLFLGTQQDNLADMRAKGRERHRSLRGEANPGHKLTADQVVEIRRYAAAGHVNKSFLAREYGVSRARIRLIIRGAAWREVAA